MKGFVQFLTSLVVLALPTKQNSVEHSTGADTGNNGDQLEEDSSSSSSDDDGHMNKSKDGSKPDGNKEKLNKAEDLHFPIFGNRTAENNRDYDTTGRPNGIQSFSSSPNHPPNMPTLTETLESTSLDRTPSEPYVFQNAQTQYALRGDEQECAYLENRSFSTLSADDLTFDARTCGVPRRMFKATSKSRAAEKQAQVNNTGHMKMKHETYEDPTEVTKKTESLNDFVKNLVMKQFSAEAHVKFYDAAILYEKEDYESAMLFKEETMMIVKSELQEEVRIELFDSQEFAQSKVCVVEDVLNKCSLVFVYLTPNFRSPELKFFIEEAIAMSRLGYGTRQNVYTAHENNDRKWILKPIHTQPPKFRAYEVPVGLLTLNGIEWYSKDSPYTKQQIRAVMHKAINTRKQKEMQTGTFPQMTGQDMSTHHNFIHTYVNKEPTKPVFQSLQPSRNQTYKSRLSQDAMSIVGETGHIQHLQQDLYSAPSNDMFYRRNGHYGNNQPHGLQQSIPTNADCHLNSQRQFNDHQQTGHFMDQHPSSMYAGHPSAQSNTMLMQISRPRVPPPAYQPPVTKDRHMQQSDAFQNQGFQVVSNQPSANTTLVYQSAGLQNNRMQPENFPNLPRPQAQIHPDDVASQRRNVYTNESIADTPSGHQGGSPVYWGQQNLYQLPHYVMAKGNRGQQNPPTSPKQYDGYQTSSYSPVMAQNSNVENLRSYQYNPHEPVPRDALHSQSGSFAHGQRSEDNPNTRVNVVSKVTGRLIINPYLSTDDVEVDNYVSTQPIATEKNRNSQNAKAKEKHGKKKKQTRSKYATETQYSSSDSEYDIPKVTTKGSKKVVNIVGCKVVQLGSGNRVKESGSRSSETISESQEMKAENKQWKGKKHVLEIDNTSTRVSSPTSLHSKMNSELDTADRNCDISEDALSVASCLERNINTISSGKSFIDNKNMPENKPSNSSRQMMVYNIPAETNQLSRVKPNQQEDQWYKSPETDRWKEFPSRENKVSKDDKRPFSSDDSDDYLFKSGIYDIGSPTGQGANAAPFTFSFQSRTSVIDVFSGSKRYQKVGKQCSEQENENSEVD